MAKGSLAVRAGLAVALMILFYALALAVVAGLIAGGIALFHALGSIRGRGTIMVGLLAIVCFSAALVIVWSILPRWDKFEPPGPEVTPDQHPELFAEIRRIAQTTGQREPAHVYLVSDVNAFVAQRGGIMGIGSSRVMGIGLPLMRSLQVDELRAVLAHEMGHFYGGDTKLGPWIYKTRGALGRTVNNLARAGAHAEEADTLGLVFRAIRAPFHWFYLGFMRVSQAISRAQEISADAVAVRAEGRRALIDGLKKSHAAGLAHVLYLRNELEPMIDQGKLPEVGTGFSQFIASKPMTELLDKVVDHELTEGTKDPYDSHPPLRERIAAAELLEAPPHEPDTRSAITLIRDPEALESADIESRVEQPLTRITWRETSAVWEKLWREHVTEGLHSLRRVSLAQFPIDSKTVYSIARDNIHGAILEQLTDNQVRGWWQNFVGAALAVRLLDAGYTMTVMPGSPFVFTKGDESVELFVEVGKRVAGETSEAAFQARCEGLGLTATTLAE